MLRQDLNVNWEELLADKNTEEKVSAFMDRLQIAMNNHIPKKKYRKRSDAVEGVVNVHLQIDCDVHMWNFRIMTLPWHSPIYVPPVQLSKRQTSNKQRSLDSYFKVARQAGNEETGDIDENSVAINPSPNESVIEAEPALACSENTPSTSSEILLSPIDYSDPVQFNKRSLSDEDRLKLLKTKWIPSSNSYIYPKNNQNRRYNKSWENDYSWLRYSPSQDGAYCSLCIAFQDHPSENPRYNEFVTIPYNDWKNALGEKRGRLALHSNSERHLKALEKSENDAWYVTEDFCGFVELVKTNAETISTCILNKLREWGFDLTRLRGQGYDGCSTMTGEVSGVKTRITQELSNAKYFVHCRSHCLNLVVVNSCQSVAVVRNFMAILGKITWFISASSKRKNIMKSVMKDEGQIAIQFDLMYDQEEGLFSQEKRLLPTLAETRWTSRTDTLTWLLKHYDKVLDILDEIQNQTVGNSDATSYKMTLLNFEILVVAVVTQFLLGYLRPLSIELQSENCDLMEAHEARSLAASFLEIREHAEEAFDGLLKEYLQSQIRTTLRSTNREHLDANAIGQMQQLKL
ncbi:unnamed protein product [Mytilus edulis]|uniref:TTF-type domain-containing protein n=1 Tax=Mytilus edulis TaxID=6550 RepID=A0A8S3TCV4_MYTED|nr:unnamed protein product [Mytilus edulis]